MILTQFAPRPTVSLGLSTYCPSVGRSWCTGPTSLQLAVTPLVCSNRAATRVNILNTQEKCHTDNMLICRYFESSRNVQQTLVLTSHGRGRWFNPSIAHSKKASETPFYYRYGAKGTGEIPLWLLSDGLLRRAAVAQNLDGRASEHGIA